MWFNCALATKFESHLKKLVEDLQESCEQYDNDSNLDPNSGTLSSTLFHTKEYNLFNHQSDDLR